MADIHKINCVGNYDLQASCASFSDSYTQYKSDNMQMLRVKLSQISQKIPAQPSWVCQHVCSFITVVISLSVQFSLKYKFSYIINENFCIKRHIIYISVSSSSRYTPVEHCGHHIYSSEENKIIGGTNYLLSNQYSHSTY